MCNAYCGAIESGGSGNGKIEYVLDIYSDRIILDGTTYTTCKGNSSASFSNQINVLYSWANYLHRVQGSGNIWSDEGSFSLRSGLGYTHSNADSIIAAIKNITGYRMPFEGGASNGSYSTFTNQDNIHARIYFVKGNFSQARIVFKTEEEIADIKVKLKLKKIDFSNKSIEAAKIKVTGEQNIDRITGRDNNYELVSGSNGSFGTITVYPKENNGEFKIKLKETKIPIGYTGTTENIILTVKYNKTTGAVTEVKSSNTEYVPNRTNNVVNVKNKSVPVNFQKVNFNGNNVSDLRFLLYLNNIDSITIEGTTIDLRDLRAEKRTKDANGNYSTICEVIGNTGYGYWAPKGDDWNRVYIFGVKPGDKITNIIPSSQNIKSIYMTLIEKRPEEYDGHAEVTDEVRVLLKIPKGYSTLPHSLRMTFTLNSNGKWTLAERNDDSAPNKLPSKYFSVNSANNTVTIKNDYQIEELSLIKTNIENTKLNGAKFNIKVENVRKIGNTTYSGTAQLSDVAITNGQLTLKGLVFNDSTKPIKVTIEETQAPEGYKKINGKMYLTITRSANNYSIVKTKDDTVLAEEFATGTISVAASNAINIGIVNLLELIDLSGQVWIDGQKGVKDADNPDGKKDSKEEKIKGVKVHLYSVKENRKISTVTTDSNGEYAFNNVIKTKEGYKIYFEYNGILYEDVGIKGDSKAKEGDSERTALNNKFKTINANGSVINGNKGIDIEYNKYNSEKKIIEFKSTVQGTKPQDSAIEAKTEKYYETAKNIDCGLLEKAFDLAIGTDVKEAKLKINEKETTYNYAQIMNGALKDKTLDEIVQNKSSDNKAPAYNIYLCKSDYNYRIKDYKTDIEGNKAPDKDNNGIADYDNLSALQAFVTYSVILKNQTTYVATVDEFAYYYNNQVYTPTFAKGDTVDGYKVENIEGNKITFVSADLEGNKLQKDDFRKELNITFEVKKDANGIILKDDIRNVAEIIKYSTVEGGLIDKDSQPGNANVTIKDGNPIVGQYEDDTDEAKGINISIKDGEERVISGTVFEDIKTNARDIDGINNDGTAVNDVIVQLVEIKKIGGQYCEYIWQETRSGSSKLRIVNKAGVVEEYPDANKDIKDGQYKFADFIPGNYIIRFIYGDGRTWDVTPNVQKYNGQDYQSTIDTNYNKTWYNASGYNDNDSVATDNESRRLKTMAYTVEVDGKIGIAIKSINTEFNDLTSEEKNLVSSYYSDILKYYNETLKNADETDIEKVAEKRALEEVSQKLYSNKDLPAANDNTKIADYYEFVKKYALQKTWMNAETAKVNVTIDANNFANINFGLRLRPETKLTVEKHITALKITPTGVGVQPVVDARVNIDDILNNNINDDTKTGITTGLAIIPSTRKERGFWKVETDIEELAQGAKLEVEYTYVIKNDSDPYYLSTFLLNEYKNNIDNLDVYKTTLENKSVEAKSSEFKKGTFLGKYYYTNKLDSQESSNLARVDKLEEALNNKLSYNESIEGASFDKTNTTGIVKKNYYNAEGNIKQLDIETILATKSATEVLEIDGTEKNRTLKLETTISALTNGEIGATIPSYITQITSYSNAAGRINKNSATPGNLAYIHNEDKRASLESYVQKDNDGNYGDKISSTEISGYVQLNEYDEFWGETIIISKPTGQDKNTILIITAIAISSITVIGVGIILIKKYVLKK